MKRVLVAALMAVCVLSDMMAARNISGAWYGTLKITPQVRLGIVFNFKTGVAGPSVTLDSPDQGAYGIPGEVKYLSADSVNVAVGSIGLSFAGHIHAGEIVGKCRQGGMNVDLSLSPEKPEIRRPQTPVPPFPYTVQDVSFDNRADNVTLSGTLTLPENCTSGTPVVVMVTGSGLQNRDEEIYGHKPFAVLADALARNGIASLRYDDRGYGKSTGDGKNAITEDFARDANAAVNFLRKEKKFKNIGILGHSEGATVAFMLSSKTSPELYARPAFIIAMGAQSVRGDSILMDQSASMLAQGGVPAEMVSDYVEALRKMYDLKISEGADAATSAVDSICAEWRQTPIHASLKDNMKKIACDTNPWLDYFIRFSPEKYITATRCPAFVLYGEKDMQVRPELNMSKIQRLAPRADVRLYPGLNHLFQHAETGAVQEYGSIEETISPGVIQDIVSFVLKQANR